MHFIGLGFFERRPVFPLSQTFGSPSPEAAAGPAAAAVRVHIIRKMRIFEDQPATMMHHKLTSKKMDYSHCPLKKRPVHFVKCEHIKSETDFGKYNNFVIIKIILWYLYYFVLYYLFSYIIIIIVREPLRGVIGVSAETHHKYFKDLCEIF